MASTTTAPKVNGGYLSGICGATSLEGKEGYAVKYSSGKFVLASAKTDIWFLLVAGNGVGGEVTVATPACPDALEFIAGGSVALGAAVAPTTNGKFITTTTTADLVAMSIDQNTVADTEPFRGVMAYRRYA